MNNIERILVPVDFSACSQAACEHAAFFAERLGAAVELLHVWDLPAWSGATLPELAVHRPEEGDPTLSGFVESRATRAMDHLVAGFERRGISAVRRRLEMGDPATTIVRVAQEGGHDLIVMGTHGRRGVSRLLMGSVAEKVVRTAPCPVLTMRVPDEPRRDHRARHRHGSHPVSNDELPEVKRLPIREGSTVGGKLAVFCPRREIEVEIDECNACARCVGLSMRDVVPRLWLGDEPARRRTACAGGAAFAPHHEPDLAEGADLHAARSGAARAVRAPGRDGRARRDGARRGAPDARAEGRLHRGRARRAAYGHSHGSGPRPARRRRAPRSGKASRSRAS